MLALLLLDELHGPDDVAGAGNKGQVGVLELIRIIQSLHEDLQLVSKEHLNVVLPSVDVLLSIY